MARVYTRKPLQERFWAKVRKGDDCWEWTAAIADTGYGIITIVDGNSGAAHRLSYEFHFGPIPDGLCVMHKCDNRKCVRPDHLMLGTTADNNRDMTEKGRRRSRVPQGVAHHGSKLNESIVALARSMWTNRGSTGKGAKGYWTLDRLAEKFGVSNSTMHAALIGKTWRHVDSEQAI